MGCRREGEAVRSRVPRRRGVREGGSGKAVLKAGIREDMKVVVMREEDEDGRRRWSSGSTSA